MTDFVDDVGYTIRSLRRTPGPTALVVMTLALGIGMTSMPSSMVDALIFRPYPILMVRFDPRLVQYNAAQTQQFYKLLAERVRVAPGVQSAALTENPPLSLSNFDAVAFVPDDFHMPRDRENFRSTMDIVDEGYFETIGIPIMRGRGFLASDTADTPRVGLTQLPFRHAMVMSLLR